MGKEEKLQPTFRKAEGKFESVGVQNGVCYLVIGGRRISCNKGEVIKVEVKKG